MRLAWIEAAEVASATAAKSTTTESAATAKASTARATEQAAAARELSALACLLDRIPHLIGDLARAGIHLSRGPRDRHRFPAEVGVSRNRRQRRSCTAARAGRSSLRLGTRCQRACKAQTLRTGACKLPHGLRSRVILPGLASGSLPGLLLLLLQRPRRQHQIEVHSLVVTRRRIQNRLLRAGRERRKLR